MNRFDWLSEYLARLEDEHAIIRGGDAAILAPAHRLLIDPEDWVEAGRVGAAMGLRHAGVWADMIEAEDVIRVQALLEWSGDYLVIETEVATAKPVLGSQTPFFPGIDRLERHAQDLLGVRFLNHPRQERWTRHCAWPADWFPLRDPGRDPPSSQTRAPADTEYPFKPIQGAGVYEIPVGPVHAGIIEPGHFRFQAAGEDVLQLEQRLGYVHKGVERLAVGRDPAGLLRLAARISGDSAVAHAWAAAQAIERALGCEIPPRALYLRALLAERERIVNHLGDIGAICNDVGFAFAHVQCARLRESWQRRQGELFGHRLLMDTLIPGGVAHDLDMNACDMLMRDHRELERAIEPLFAIIDDHPPLNDRLLTTGTLSPSKARALGCTGYVGKASAQPFDVRRDNPYSPYDALTIESAIEQDGDVAARVRVRMTEIRASLRLLQQLLDRLPTGEIATGLPVPEPDSMGLGVIDGWRGEILCFVRFDGDGRIARYFPRDPSWFTWPALERLILGNIVPDFPVCNKSVNGSYSGVDL